jgi:hypothetical protein
MCNHIHDITLAIEIMRIFRQDGRHGKAEFALRTSGLNNAARVPIRIAGSVTRNREVFAP